jgi:hypothetical protein
MSESHLLDEKETSLIILGHTGLLPLGLAETVTSAMAKVAISVALLLAAVHWRLGPSLASSVRNRFATRPGTLATTTTLAMSATSARSASTVWPSRVLLLVRSQPLLLGQVQLVFIMPVHRNVIVLSHLKSTGDLLH